MTVSPSVVAAHSALAAASREVEDARREYRDARTPAEQEEALASLNAALRYRRSCADRLERLTGRGVTFAAELAVERAEQDEADARRAFLSAPLLLPALRALVALRAAARRTRELRAASAR